MRVVFHCIDKYLVSQVEKHLDHKKVKLVETRSLEAVRQAIDSQQTKIVIINFHAPASEWLVEFSKEKQKRVILCSSLTVPARVGERVDAVVFVNQEGPRLLEAIVRLLR